MNHEFNYYHIHGIIHILEILKNMLCCTEYGGLRIELLGEPYSYEYSIAIFEEEHTLLRIKLLYASYSVASLQYIVF